VYTKSNLDWDNHSWNWKVKSKYSDKIISISQATDKLLIDKGFSNKIEKVFLGIDTDWFQYSEAKRQNMREQHNIPTGAFIFGCAAQFIPLKDHGSIIDAFENVSLKYSNTYLFLCGPHHNDSYYNSIIKKINESSVKDKICLLGVLEDMRPFYSAIDCFVLASLYETFGYVYVEAMSCERPVIASKAGGPEEIVDEGKTGFFVEKSNPRDIAEKMVRYLDNKELIGEHGGLARKRVVKHFSKEAMAKNTQSLYLKLLEGTTND
jgi:glycosyltransferase involved in cell wall biosynthesis